MRPRNRQRVNLYIWIGVTLLAGYAAVAPFLYDIPMERGGGALVFVGAIMFFSGIFVSLLFYKRSKTDQAIALGDVPILARWQYEAGAWQDYAASASREWRVTNARTFAIIAAFAVPLAVFFALALGEAGLWTALVLLGVLGLCAIMVFLPPAVQYRRLLRSDRTVVITPVGVDLAGTLHNWNQALARLQGVRVEGNQLRFTYMAPVAGRGVQEYTFGVPIPHGEEDAALRVVAYFAEPGRERS